MRHLQFMLRVLTFDLSLPSPRKKKTKKIQNVKVFRILMENRFVPDRTVEFHAYAAEEAGLRGSAAISQEYATTPPPSTSFFFLGNSGGQQDGGRRTPSVLSNVR